MNKMQILIVDDEVEFASTLVERLALRGIEAISANRGVEALARVKDGNGIKGVVDYVVVRP